jgi:flagellar motility protein MotE (MotC chaperone)
MLGNLDNKALKDCLEQIVGSPSATVAFELAERIFTLMQQRENPEKSIQGLDELNKFFSTLVLLTKWGELKLEELISYLKGGGGYNETLLKKVYNGKIPSDLFTAIRSIRQFLSNPANEANIKEQPTLFEMIAKGFPDLKLIAKELSDDLRETDSEREKLHNAMKKNILGEKEIIENSEKIQTVTNSLEQKMKRRFLKAEAIIALLSQAFDSPVAVTLDPIEADATTAKTMANLTKTIGGAFLRANAPTSAINSPILVLAYLLWKRDSVGEKILRETGILLL